MQLTESLDRYFCGQIRAVLYSNEAETWMLASTIGRLG